MSETGTIVEEKFGAYEDHSLTQDSAGEVEALPTQNSAISQPEGASNKAPKSSSESVPSSPPVDRVFSSDILQESDSELSSLPSSPPPLPSPEPASRKPAFSFLKRKRTTLDDRTVSEPLSDITPNSRKVPPSDKKTLTQMRIDLGGEVRKSCRTCGMEYIPSVKEDSALHSKFCGMNLGGVDMGKAFLKDESVRRIYSERTASKQREMVVVVDRSSSSAARNKTRKVLEVVNAELSSADINDEDLWGSLCPQWTVTGARKRQNDKVERIGDRFKAFLGMVDDKCVGFCLAEKISTAFRVVPKEDTENQVMISNKSSSISASTASDVALLGISRIWTSKSHRERGIANDLLNCTRMNFFYGVEAPKNLVAFSQPTESGARLAERWFQASAGWHVYGGDQ